VGFCNLVTKHANPCGAVTTWVVWANTRLITCFGFLVDLFTGFCGSPPARYGGSILTIYTSYDVLPHIATQTDAFWGGVDTAPHLDRRHTCDFIARFCRATIARQNRKCDMPCRTLQLCRIDKNWPISVHRIFATKLHRIERCSNRKRSYATVEKLRDTPCHTCDFVAR